MAILRFFLQFAPVCETAVHALFGESNPREICIYGRSLADIHAKEVRGDYSEVCDKRLTLAVRAYAFRRGKMNE
jgi:hypothetical protein